MGDWSSFGKDKIVTDAWRSFLNEGASRQLDERRRKRGMAGTMKRTTGKLEKTCSKNCCGEGTKLDAHTTDDLGNIVVKGTYKCLSIGEWETKHGKAAKKKKKEKGEPTEPTPVDVEEEEPIHIFRAGGAQNDSLVNILTGVGLPKWAVKALAKRVKQELEANDFVVKEGLYDEGKRGGKRSKAARKKAQKAKKARLARQAAERGTARAVAASPRGATPHPTREDPAPSVTGDDEEDTFMKPPAPAPTPVAPSSEPPALKPPPDVDPNLGDKVEKYMEDNPFLQPYIEYAADEFWKWLDKITTPDEQVTTEKIQAVVDKLPIEEKEKIERLTNGEPTPPEKPTDVTEPTPPEKPTDVTEPTPDKPVATEPTPPETPEVPRGERPPKEEDPHGDDEGPPDVEPEPPAPKPPPDVEPPTEEPEAPEEVGPEIPEATSEKGIFKISDLRKIMELPGKPPVPPEKIRPAQKAIAAYLRPTLEKAGIKLRERQLSDISIDFIEHVNDRQINIINESVKSRWQLLAGIK